jgi:hypothetical protein
MQPLLDSFWPISGMSKPICDALRRNQAIRTANRRLA